MKREVLAAGVWHSKQRQTSSPQAPGEAGEAIKSKGVSDRSSRNKQQQQRSQMKSPIVKMLHKIDEKTVGRVTS